MTILFFVGYQSGHDNLWGFAGATLFLTLMLGLSALTLHSRQPLLLLALLILDLFTQHPGSHTGGPIQEPFPQQPLLAVPFIPTHAEYIYLQGRRVLADQMEFLRAHFPRSSPLHGRLAHAC